MPSKRKGGQSLGRIYKGTKHANKIVHIISSSSSPTSCLQAPRTKRNTYASKCRQGSPSNI